ncbi:MAG: hypothetical protein ACI841_003027 [Planctomycetota bacterium]|jgi:hypothetical protein
MEPIPDAAYDLLENFIEQRGSEHRLAFEDWVTAYPTQAELLRHLWLSWQRANAELMRRSLSYGGRSPPSR